jgi:hypothetical protein
MKKSSFLGRKKFGRIDSKPRISDFVDVKQAALIFNFRIKRAFFTSSLFIILLFVPI